MKEIKHFRFTLEGANVIKVIAMSHNYFGGDKNH